MHVGMWGWFKGMRGCSVPPRDASITSLLWALSEATHQGQSPEKLNAALVPGGSMALQTKHTTTHINTQNIYSQYITNIYTNTQHTYIHTNTHSHTQAHIQHIFTIHSAHSTHTYNYNTHTYTQTHIHILTIHSTHYTQSTYTYNTHIYTQIHIHILTSTHTTHSLTTHTRTHITYTHTHHTHIHTHIHVCTTHKHTHNTHRCIHATHIHTNTHHPHTHIHTPHTNAPTCAHTHQGWLSAPYSTLLIPRNWFQFLPRWMSGQNENQSRLSLLRRFLLSWPRVLKIGDLESECPFQSAWAPGFDDNGKARRPSEV
jgi:hypothetical protein